MRKLFGCSRVDRSSTVREITREGFKNCLESADFQDQMAAYYDCDDPDQKKEMKKSMLCLAPMFIPTAEQNPDGSYPRRLADSKFSGHLFLDIDTPKHDEGVDAYTLFNNQIKPHLSEGYITGVSMSSSTKSFHIHALAQEAWGKTLKEQLEHLATLLGVTPDPACAQRCTLCIPTGNWIYFSEELFWSDGFTELEDDYVPQTATADKAAVISTADDIDVESDLLINGNVPCGGLIKALMEEWQMDGSEGGRNELVLRLGKVFYSLGFTQEQASEIIPDFGLSEEEYTTTLTNAQKYATPGHPSKEVSDILARLSASIKAEQDNATVAAMEQALDAQVAADADVTDTADAATAVVTTAEEITADNYKHMRPQVTEIQHLPQELRIILKRFPAFTHRPILMAVLIVFMFFLSTNVKYKNLANSVRNLIGSGNLFAPSGSGKSCINELVRWLCKCIGDADKNNRDALNQWLENKNNGGTATAKPQTIIRMPVHPTSSVLLDYMNSSGLGTFLFESEMSNIAGTTRSKFYDFQSIMLTSWESEVCGNESISSCTKNISIVPLLSSLFTGTPEAMLQFYNDFASGIVQRQCFFTFDDTQERLIYKDLTANESQMVEALIARLLHVGHDPQASLADCISKPGTEIVVDLKRTKRELLRLQADITQRYTEDDCEYNHAVLQISHRGLEFALRCAVVMYYLEGEKETNTVIDIACWAWRVFLSGQLELFGNEWLGTSAFKETHMKNLKAMAEGSQRVSQLAGVAPNIGDTFTAKDVCTFRQLHPEMNLSTDMNAIYVSLHRWIKNGLAERVDGGYRRLK